MLIQVSPQTALMSPLWVRISSTAPVPWLEYYQWQGTSETPVSCPLKNCRQCFAGRHWLFMEDEDLEKQISHRHTAMAAYSSFYWGNPISCCAEKLKTKTVLEQSSDPRKDGVRVSSVRSHTKNSFQWRKSFLRYFSKVKQCLSAFSCACFWLLSV